MLTKIPPDNLPLARLGVQLPNRSGGGESGNISGKVQNSQ